MTEVEEYLKPSRKNPVAKYMERFNKPKVEKSKKGMYNRSGKAKWRYEDER